MRLGEDCVNCFMVKFGRFNGVKNYIPEFVLIGGLFVWYLIWANSIAFCNAPDEWMKWQLIDYVFKTGIYPPGYEPSLIDPIYGNTYAFEPAISYLLGAGMVKLTSLFTQDHTAYITAARMVSVLFSCGTVFLLFRIGNRLFKKPLAWLMVLAVALLPQYTFMSSYINNDMFGIFCGALIIYFWIRGLDSGWATKDVIGLAIGFGLCLISYYFAYPYLLMSIILFAASMIHFTRKKKFGITGGVITKKLIIILVIVFAIAGWYFIRNAVLYNGDIFAMDSSSALAERYAAPDMRPSVRPTPQNMGISLPEMIFGMNWADTSLLSFFAVFGNMTVSAAKWLFVLFLIIAGAGAVFSLNFKRMAAAKVESKLLMAALILSAAGVILISLYYSYTADFQPQGRYLMQAVIPFAVVFCMGWQNIGDILRKKVNFEISYVVMAVIIFINIYCYFSYIQPGLQTLPFA